MPTLRDVAELAGVSVATVSHVINKTRRISDGTTERVERAIKTLGYVPNEAGREFALQRGSGRDGGETSVAASGANSEDDEDNDSAPSGSRTRAVVSDPETTASGRTGRK